MTLGSAYDGSHSGSSITCESASWNVRPSAYGMVSWRKTRSRGDPPVAMMKAAELWHRDDTAHRWRLGIASNRHVAPKRHAGAIRVVVRNVRAENPTQVVLAQHDHVVDNFPTRSAHPSFGEPALPWAPSRDSELRQTEVVATVERRAEDLVAVADQSSGPTASTICCAAHSAGLRHGLRRQRRGNLSGRALRRQAEPDRDRARLLHVSVELADERSAPFRIRLRHRPRSRAQCLCLRQREPGRDLRSEPAIGARWRRNRDEPQWGRIPHRQRTRRCRTGSAMPRTKTKTATVRDAHAAEKKNGKKSIASLRGGRVQSRRQRACRPCD
jgi:hypothetical protein